MITLIQKISDGIVNRYHRSVSESTKELPPYASGLRGKIPPFDPRIIRHYEDSAAIILHINQCYPLKDIADYQSLFKELMTRRMVRRKLEEGTMIHNDESLQLLNKDKLASLDLCQQQRLCLYYFNHNDNHLFPLSVESCGNIIQKWLESVGL